MNKQSKTWHYILIVSLLLLGLYALALGLGTLILSMLFFREETIVVTLLAGPLIGMGLFWFITSFLLLKERQIGVTLLKVSSGVLFAISVVTTVVSISIDGISGPRLFQMFWMIIGSIPNSLPSVFIPVESFQLSMLFGSIIPLLLPVLLFLLAHKEDQHLKKLK